MKTRDVYDHIGLRQQISMQKKHHWDLEKDVQWDKSVDLSCYLLPLDDEAIAFPGANPKQRLALSQLMGLIVNATIAEMEEVAFKLRDTAWRSILRQNPINPEFIELGEVFFAEEAKHSQLFKRYNQTFCERIGIESSDLNLIIPQAYGAIFQRAVKSNAERGGHAFWWVIAVVEEVSLLIYQNLYRHRKEVDPLFFEVHKRHFEEESKHTNYAFMMLEVIKNKPKSIKNRLHKSLDLIYSELFSTGWVLAELHRITRAKDLAHKHEFFATLASCLPLMEKLPKHQLIRRLFVSAPYISLILNKKHHKYSLGSAKEHKAFTFKYPKPEKIVTKTAEELQSYSAEDVWAS